MSAREVVMIRFGEIFLKGDNRHLFERRLVDNCERAIAHVEGAKIERQRGRLFVWPGAAGTAPLERSLKRVFGIASLSPARVVERKLTAIEQTAIEVARLQTEQGKRSFKVESRRADKQFVPASPEISRQVGAAIVGALGLPVDVHTPDFTVGVEIGLEHAMVFSAIVAGPGGLPVGSTGKVELLLSGGIDSPVAGWLMLKRGCELSATYFHSFPYTGDKTKEKVITLASKLAGWQLQPLTLTIVPLTEAQKALRGLDEEGRLAVVLYRRMMVRIAEVIARERGARALVTGEALAQVASQTLENMSVIDEVAELPILRPCLAHDKVETIAMARRIDTYETSILPYDDCCSLFVPDHPETRAHLERVQRLESRLDIAALVSDCVSRREMITVPAK